MRIEVETLTEKAQPFAHTYQPEEVSLDDEQARVMSEAVVSGSARRRGEEVRLRGGIKTEAEVLCDRCLAPTRMLLDIEFDTGFIPEEKAALKTDNVELLSEDLGIAAFDGVAIDLDELVREQILLALPTRHLCREECKGLCQRCGADLNAEQCSCEQREIDPRWSALAGLKKKGE